MRFDLPLWHASTQLNRNIARSGLVFRYGKSGVTAQPLVQGLESHALLTSTPHTNAVESSEPSGSHRGPCPRPRRRCITAGPDHSVRWPSPPRLVATATPIRVIKQLGIR